MNLSGDIGLIATLIIVFTTTGLASGLSPCTLPTIAFIVAYVGGNQNYSKKKGFVLSLAFVFGIALMLSILGMFAGLLGNVLLKAHILNYLIGFILIIMGLWQLKVFDFSGN